ncbi:hypothetical protein PybrP1_004808 [[Pythium] brassicae (nom. inval.)]|nr:hypothetical protein PybrP1_004808 [[Pythium] brassicae (nom. inval.)]
MGNRSSVLHQQHTAASTRPDGGARYHKTRRSQASRRRRESSSSSSSANESQPPRRNSDASALRRQSDVSDDDPPPVTKMQHSLSDTTTSSSNGSGPESPLEPPGSGRADLLASLRKRYQDAVPRLSVPRLSRPSDSDAPRRENTMLVQKMLILNDAVVMIQLLLEYLQTSMDVSACAVFLIDQSTQVMSRFSPDKTSVSGIDPARGVLGWTLAKRGAICKANFKHVPSYDPEIDLDQEWASQKLFCVPLIENDIVYAVIQATTKKNTCKELDDLHMKLLSWLGPILGSCMRKCIEYHDVLLSDRTQKALLHIISSSDTEDTVLNLVAGVVAGACHITKAERLTLFMVDWETDELWSLSSSYHEETLRLPLHASILGTAAKSRTILNVCNPASDSRYNSMVDQRRGVQVRCALYVPVGVENTKAEGSSHPIAVLEILNKAEGVEFTFDDECAFEAFASQVAVILRRRSNEIEYIKLLADTRAEKVLAQRAKSQVNILEAYTSYSSTMRAQPSEWLRNSFMKTQVRDCEACARQNMLGSPCCDLHSAPSLGPSWLRPPTLERQFSKSSSTGPSIPSWDFNVFLADMDSLPELIENMFMKYNLPRVLNISQQRMQNFILVIKENYHPNPFHNFLHAFSVVHTAYLLLSTTEAARMLRPLDIAGCLIAALCHDVDHPGHTNAYEIQSGSQLAMLYSDESVLERHHAYTTFKLMSKEKSANILENLSASDYRHVRKVIITAILGTDMANHFKFCETLEKTLNPPVRHISSSALVSAKNGLRHVEGFGSGSEKSSSSSEIRTVLRDAVFQSEGSAANTPRNSSSGAAKAKAFCFPKSLSGLSQTREVGNGWLYNGTVDERLFVVKTIVHASDLSGQVFSKPVALKWSNMISKEFAYQALLEQAENHPISYHDLNDPLQMVEGQLFFAQKIVAPLWELVHVMFPEVACCVKNLSENVAHYEQELQRLRMSHEEERKMSEPMPITETIQEDEGLAVPGLAKCTPARFNSFRSIREVSESFDDADDRSLRDFAASAIEAIELSRESSLARSRNNSNSSSSSGEEDVAVAVEALDECTCSALLD